MLGTGLSSVHPPHPMYRPVANLLRVTSAFGWEPVGHQSAELRQGFDPKRTSLARMRIAAQMWWARTLRPQPLPFGTPSSRSWVMT